MITAPSVSTEIRGLYCDWCAAVQLDNLLPTQDYILNEPKTIDAKLCENSQHNQYPVIRKPCPTVMNDQVEFRFYPVPNQTGLYYIQNKLKQITCSGYDFLTYDENAPYCLTPCDPTVPNSECAGWAGAYDRVPITTTSVANKKKWSV